MDLKDITKYFSIINLSNNVNNVCVINDDDFQFFLKHSLHIYLISLNGIQITSTSIERHRLAIMGEVNFQHRTYQLTQIAECFEQNNINYRVLKGIGIALSYPEPSSRLMGDIDIIVKPCDFRNAYEKLLENGYFCEYYDDQKVNLTFYKANSLNVELHQMLFNKNEIDQFTDLENEIWNQEYIQILLEIPVKFPDPFVHLKYQIIHMIKHFQLKGSGLRFLLDIYFFSRYHNINLENLFTVFEDTDYEVFYLTLIGCMKKYLKSDIVKFIDNKKVNNILIDKMTEYILDNGTYGQNNAENASDFRYYKYKKVADKSRLKAIRFAFFPSTSEIGTHYKYAKKNKLLLPLAWCHRFFYTLFSTKHSLTEKSFVFTKNKKEINKKIELLKELKLYK